MSTPSTFPASSVRTSCKHSGTHPGTVQEVLCTPPHPTPFSLWLLQRGFATDSCTVWWAMQRSVPHKVHLGTYTVLCTGVVSSMLVTLFISFPRANPVPRRAGTTTRTPPPWAVNLLHWLDPRTVSSNGHAFIRGVNTAPRAMKDQ